jgi:8-oxo-dGTP pyrophosphatase MutT (NUDIX family)
MTVAPARPASTVVLVRPSTSGFEVFLVRRHHNVAFMGGAHVFPGGRVDPGDRLVMPEGFCDGVEAATQRAADLPPLDAVAHYVAAIRELFEEAGVLLARRADGRLIDFTDADESNRFRAYRSAVADGSMTMRELAERERLRFALDEIALFAHWVTPAVETKRFDTRFFVAALPAGQEPVHDQTETTDSEWMHPADATERCIRNEIALPPPTWTTLRTLAKLGNAGEVMEWARQQRVVRVEPMFIKNETETMLTLPGDPTCPPLEGFEPVDETRFRLEDGRWRAVSSP